MFKVDLQNGHRCLAHISGKNADDHSRRSGGQGVGRAESYDLKRGRITRMGEVLSNHESPGIRQEALAISVESIRREGTIRVICLRAEATKSDNSTIKIINKQRHKQEG